MEKKYVSMLLLMVGNDKLWADWWKDEMKEYVCVQEKEYTFLHIYTYIDR